MRQRTDAEVIRDHELRATRHKQLKLFLKGTKKAQRDAAKLRAITTPLTDKQREQGRA